MRNTTSRFSSSGQQQPSTISAALLLLLLVSFTTTTTTTRQCQAFILPSKFTTPTPTFSTKHTPQKNNVDDPQHFHSKRTPTPTKHTRDSTSSSTKLYGIPKMFRWLTDQYPNINSRLSEGLSSDKVVDNFYLDMNGIIHPCTHGNNNDEIVVLDETAMFKKIFGYVDR